MNYETSTITLLNCLKYSLNFTIQLKGNKVNRTRAKSALSTFVSKLQLFKRNITLRELSQFPSLSEVEEKVPDDGVQLYSAHLDELHGKHMSDRFQDRDTIFVFLDTIRRQGLWTKN